MSSMTTEILGTKTAPPAYLPFEGGRYRIAMADGSVWLQIDDRRMALSPRPGQKIQIKTASLGSYFLSLEGRPAIRVRRER